MSFFVLDTIERLREEDDWEGFNKAKDYQEAFYNKVCRECFEIVYYGRYSAEFVDQMSPFERRQTIDFLNEYRKSDDENTAKLLAALTPGGRR